jgi:hypothetical protein
MLGLVACSSAPVTTGPPVDAGAEFPADAATNLPADGASDVTTDAGSHVATDAGTDLAPAATDTAQGHSICTGGDEIRLAIQVAGGGPASPGQAMLAQNGWSFLLVDGSCIAWVLKDYAGRLVRAALSAADENELATTLSLSTWDNISVPAGGGCFDAPGISFHFADRRLSGPSCGVPANSAWKQLNDAGNQEISRVAALGSPWDGDVRYLLLQEATAPDNRGAVTWPLASSLSAIAVPSSQMFTYRPEAILLATGEDAAKVRALRTIPRADATAYYNFTRVTDAGGGTYQLFVRDVLPFEQPSGGLPAGVF